MSTTTLDRPFADTCRNIVGKAAEACGKTVHLVEEVRGLKDTTTNALDEGVEAAKKAFRAATRNVPSAADIKDEAVYRIKRRPLRALGLALGAGIATGVIINWATRRCTRPAEHRAH